MQEQDLHPLFVNRILHAGAGGWSWSGVRKKYYYLTDGWRLVLEEYERGVLKGMEAKAPDSSRTR